MQGKNVNGMRQDPSSVSKSEVKRLKGQGLTLIVPLTTPFLSRER